MQRFLQVQRLVLQVQRLVLQVQRLVHDTSSILLAHHARNFAPRLGGGVAWTPAEDALLGAAADASIAARIGRTLMAVTIRRGALGVPPFTKRRWTAEDDALLGTMPDAEVAAKLGRTVWAVTVRRCEKNRRNGR